MTAQRRQFLKYLGGASLGAFAAANWPVAEVKAAGNQLAGLSAKEAATAEDYWSTVQSAFSPSKEFINLENGYYSLQPDIVKSSLIKNIEMINDIPSLYMRTRQKQERAAVK